jgi:hypothetical protein
VQARRATAASLNRRTISQADVPRIFDAAQVERLAQILRLPADADSAKLAADLQQAARIYLRDAGEPSLNAQRREIRALYRLLESYITAVASTTHSGARSETLRVRLADLSERLAVATEAMSPAVRRSLEARGAVIDDRRRTLTNRRMRNLPAPGELRDPLACDHAVEHLRTLIDVGGYWGEGRNRPTGRRSRTWKPLLHAPVASRGEPRREAERFLVINLQIAVSEATGKLVSRTADPRKPGPFARFAAETLRLVRAVGPANAIGVAVEIINGLDRERKARRQRAPCHE